MGETDHIATCVFAERNKPLVHEQTLENNKAAERDQRMVASKLGAMRDAIKDVVLVMTLLLPNAKAWVAQERLNRVLMMEDIRTFGDSTEEYMYHERLETVLKNRTDVVCTHTA